MTRAAHRLMAIGPTDEPLLLALSRYFYLTAHQLTRLAYAAGSLTHVQDKLKRLTAHGYLQSIPLPRPTRRGNAPLVYTLARKGFTHLVELGLDLDPRYRPSEVK